MRSSVVAVVWMALAGVAAASDADAAIKKFINIPAQPLKPALQAFSKQRDLQIIFRTDVVGKRLSAGAVGELTADEALTAILSGTGLTYSYLDDRTVTVVPIPSTSSRREGAVMGRSEWLRVAQASAGAAATAASVRKNGDGRGLGVTLEEVVVTAQKREESLQSVPIAVTAVDAQTLQERRVFQLSELGYVSPSFQATSTDSESTATNFLIRGVGTSAFGNAIEPSVSVVIDDVVLARPFMGVVRFFDLERVEILRGPQGTLFGKNASAGLVNIVTARPRLAATEAKLSVSYANQNSGSDGHSGIVEGMFNTPVSENAALRTSVFGSRVGGFVENVARDEDLGVTQAGGRVKYLWQPHESWEIFLAADAAKSDGPGAGLYARRFDVPGGTIEAANSALGIVASSENLKIAGLGRSDNSFTVGGVQARIGYEFERGYSVTNIAAYRQFEDKTFLEADQLPLSIIDAAFYSRSQSQFSNELRLTAPSGGVLEYQVGAYYLTFDSDVYQTVAADFETILPPAPAGVINVGGEERDRFQSSSTALFAQGQVSLSNEWRAIAGARQTHDELDGTLFLGSFNALNPAWSPGTRAASRSNDNFSFRIGTEVDLAPEIMSYLTFTRGYKGPAFSNKTLFDVEPEIPTAWEIGIKSRLFDNRLVFNAVVYTSKFKNFQAQAFRPAEPQGLFTTVNAGQLGVEGIETEFDGLLGHGWRMRGGVTYNDAVYDSFTGSPCYGGQPAGASGRGVCLPNGTTDVSGNSLTNAPKWSGSVAVSREWQAGGLSLHMDVNYFYRSSVYFTAARDPYTWLGGYGQLGASFAVSPHDDRWKMTLFVRNATDERAPGNITADFISGGHYWSQFNEGSFRTIGLALDYAW